MVDIEVDTDCIVDRLSGRRECSACGATYHVKDNPSKQDGVCDQCGNALVQRADDVPDVIRNRIEVYHEQTEPLKHFYATRNLLVAVEGKITVSETTEAVLAAIREKIVEA